jgi:SSS family solute:Na+ symporter
MIAGVMVRKHVSKVEHFLVAGREMNVYLGIASLVATEFGIVTCMYTAQAGYTRWLAGVVIVLGGLLNMIRPGATSRAPPFASSPGRPIRAG